MTKKIYYPKTSLSGTYKDLSEGKTINLKANGQAEITQAKNMTSHGYWHYNNDLKRVVIKPLSQKSARPLSLEEINITANRMPAKYEKVSSKENNSKNRQTERKMENVKIYTEGEYAEDGVHFFIDHKGRIHDRGNKDLMPGEYKNESGKKVYTIKKNGQLIIHHRNSSSTKAVWSWEGDRIINSRNRTELTHIKKGVLYIKGSDITLTLSK